MLTEAQKGVREVVERFLTSHRKPLKSKWKMSLGKKDGQVFYVFTHYHHVLLVVDPHTKSITYQWWEKPTDLRGLQSAILVLKEYYIIKEDYQWDNITKQFVLMQNNALLQTELN